ncbi:hypothetical protein GMLC_25340 [Geomonas limicola]|uniref:Lipoprotein n=1 Tax=Geomonas limicola TaxID=2740186 RepID=A0A6V8N8R0_9BACT|nr:hypothetical protein [Geomonas limicola]GFO68955.1 hypothetical protein GMLC_25340 [Geomonas limicola]
MRFLILMVLLAANLLSGCGTGSGAGGVMDATVPPRNLTVQLATQAANPATVYYSAELTLRLPAGVTVQAAADTGVIAADVFVAADPTALAGARFVAASTSKPATVKVIVANPTGMVVGPLATLTCSTASTTLPGASSFSLEEFVVKDASGIPLDTVTPKLAVQPL